MSYDYREMIINNIKMLIEKNSTNATRLSDELGIYQSHMSKALNPREKTQFTLDQIIKIADHFKVSVDFILGRNKNYSTSSISNKEICILLRTFLESGVIELTESDIREFAYIKSTSRDPYQYEYDLDTNHISKYNCFYFPNFEYNCDRDDPFNEDFFEVIQDYQNFGNENQKSIEINDFIKFYLELSKLYKNKYLSSEIFEKAIQDRLDNMKY